MRSPGFGQINVSASNENILLENCTQHASCCKTAARLILEIILLEATAFALFLEVFQLVELFLLNLEARQH